MIVDCRFGGQLDRDPIDSRKLVLAPPQMSVAER